MEEIYFFVQQRFFEGSLCCLVVPLGHKGPFRLLPPMFPRNSPPLPMNFHFLYSYSLNVLGLRSSLYLSVDFVPSFLFVHHSFSEDFWKHGPKICNGNTGIFWCTPQSNDPCYHMQSITLLAYNFHYMLFFLLLS